MSAELPELKKFDEAELDRVFAQLEREVAVQAAALTSDAAIEAFRLEWLGRKQGRLGQLSASWLKNAPADAKKSLGIRFNKLKSQIEAARTSTPSETKETSGLDITLPGSAYAGVIIMTLYIRDPDTRLLYGHPYLLWLVIPVMLLWLSQVWMRDRKSVV